MKAKSNPKSPRARTERAKPRSVQRVVRARREIKLIRTVVATEYVTVLARTITEAKAVADNWPKSRGGEVAGKWKRPNNAIA